MPLVQPADERLRAARVVRVVAVFQLDLAGVKDRVEGIDDVLLEHAGSRDDLEDRAAGVQNDLMVVAVALLGPGDVVGPEVVPQRQEDVQSDEEGKPYG